MAHRRGSFRGRSGISDAQRRKKSWTGFGVENNVETGLTISTGDTGGVAGSSLGLLIVSSANGAGLGFLEGTLIRMRGSVEIPKSTTPGFGGNSGTTVAVGIGFASDEAALAGAVPNPAESLGADWDGWMFYRSQMQGNLDANSGVMDVKSMRKWQSGNSLIIVAGVSTSLVAGASDQTISMLIRGLFLLP